VAEQCDIRLQIQFVQQLLQVRPLFSRTGNRTAKLHTAVFQRMAGLQQELVILDPMQTSDAENSKEPWEFEGESGAACEAQPCPAPPNLLPSSKGRRHRPSRSRRIPKWN